MAQQTRRDLSDPDRAFRNLDDESAYKFLLLESDAAEQLFAAHYLDLELEPYQVFYLKVLRGRFNSQAEVDKFIDENDLNWVYDNGYIMHNGKPGFSPHYFDTPHAPGVPNVCILVPAGHGKTTIVSTRCLPVMSICDNPNARLQFIAKNETESFSFSTNIRRELANVKLVKDFGEFRPRDKDVPWSNQAFSVHQRQWRDVRENFEFYGTNSHAELGKRSDGVLMDDTETPDTARTPDMRDKYLEWTQIGPFTSPRPAFPRDKNGRVLIPKKYKWSTTAKFWGVGVVGTIFHPEAFYAMLHKNATFTCIKFDCWRDRKCSVPIAPKMMNKEALEAARESIGTISFNKRYRNIAFNAEEMAFREEWIRGRPEMVNGVVVEHPGCLDRNRSFGEVHASEKVYLGFDPASGSKSRWSAYSAYFLFAFNPSDPERKLYVVDFLKTQDQFDRMLDHLLEGNHAYGIEGFLSKYRYECGTVEKNAFGKWLVDNDRIKPYITRNVIRPHTTGNNKTDPESGVFAMGEMFENGRIRIPYATPHDESKAEEMIGDLLLYPKGTNDLVMAMWLAQLPIRSSQAQYKSWYTASGKGGYVKNPAYYE